MSHHPSPWRKIDEALGLAPTDPRMQEAFEAAGFDKQQSSRAVAMMRSGQYFGFADVATALAMANGQTISPVQESQIAKAARAWEDDAVIRGEATRTPWGRVQMKESATNPFGRQLPPRQPAETDFVEVGLSEAHAKEAHEGLASGRFVSFEDACLSTAMHKVGSPTLQEAAMREKARRFAGGNGR